MMTMQDTCLFVPKQYDFSSIHTLNFVFETKQKETEEDKWEMLSYYSINIVVKGTCTFKTKLGEHKLKKGDIFFRLPAMQYKFSDLDNFQYMYISYLGIRSNLIMNELNIDRNHYVFKDNEELVDFYLKSIELKSEFLELQTESVLLYSFAYLGKNRKNNVMQQTKNASNMIKQYINENFTDSNLTLEKISRQLSYNKKYISSLFKESFNIGICEYIKNIRIQNACTLIQKGFASVKNIAFLCGFNDPLYFSKLFKKEMGESPKDRINRLKEQMFIDVDA